MKKLLLIILSAFFLAGCFHSFENSEDISDGIPKDDEVVACTMEYAPVCGKIQVQCITTPCDPVEFTFLNMCVANVASAFDIVDGECDSDLGIVDNSEIMVKNPDNTLDPGTIFGTFGKSGKTAEGFSWYVNYTFKEGSLYEMEGYPSIYEEGTYEVVSKDDNSAVVEVFPPDRKDDYSYNLTFTFSEDGDSFIKQGDSERYYRQ